MMIMNNNNNNKTELKEAQTEKEINSIFYFLKKVL